MDLVTRYNAGEDTPVSRREYGISETRLRHLLLVEGEVFRRQAIIAEEGEQAVRRYASGLKTRQVAARVRSTYGTVRGLLHQSSAEVRVSPVRKRAKSEG